MAKLSAFEFNANGALIRVEENPCCLRPYDDVQIGPLAANVAQKCLCGGAARATPNCALRDGESRLLCAIYVNVRVTKVFARLDEGAAYGRCVMGRGNCERAAVAFFSFFIFGFRKMRAN